MQSTSQDTPAVRNSRGLLSNADPLLLLAFPVLTLWFSKVSDIVPEPYLDEVFHIPQAQAYWAGQWTKWDPKITTPPGLYLYSIAVCKLSERLMPFNGFSTATLRLTNVVLAAGIPVLLGLAHPKRQPGRRRRGFEVTLLMHANLNVMLFPLLFFFSALYYTDVLSTVVVMVTYGMRTRLLRSSRSAGLATAVLGRSLVLLLGVYAMLVRQTNVFWVAVFLAGLRAVETLSEKGDLYDPVSSDATVEGSWEQLRVYSTSLYLLDYVHTAYSLPINAGKNIPVLLQSLVIYVSLLVAFAAFVFWNGGVVLGKFATLLLRTLLTLAGDKSNHVTSIHLPQMLYIWPCIVFFSWPVVLPVVATMRLNQLPRIWVALSIITVMLAAVHFNTLVHPFILADNRHYVFYVFRILLRHPFIKYAAVPIYFGCAWLVIAALGEPNLQDTDSEVPRMSNYLGVGGQSTRTSFVMVWLASTTLSLVTAPLVEPRYFLIPWLMWRLNVPNHTISGKENNYRAGALQQVLSVAAANRLWIETCWYLLINAVTCYVFLYRGFEWSQEPGRVQRFMW